jgi:hypothetical protein
VRRHRHYALDEARAQLRWVTERLAAMRSAREAHRRRPRRALAGSSGGNGGGALGKHVGEARAMLDFDTL